MTRSYVTTSPRSHHSTKNKGPAASGRSPLDSLLKKTARKKTKTPLVEFATKKAGTTGQAAAPKPAAAAPQAESGPDTMSVICPDGVGAGDWIVVDTPDGRELEAQVPPGVQPGIEFSVALPPPPSPRPTSSNPGRIVTAQHA